MCQRLWLVCVEWDDNQLLGGLSGLNETLTTGPAQGKRFESVVIVLTVPKTPFRRCTPTAESTRHFCLTRTDVQLAHLSEELLVTTAPALQPSFDRYVLNVAYWVHTMPGAVVTKHRRWRGGCSEVSLAEPGLLKRARGLTDPLSPREEKPAGRAQSGLSCGGANEGRR